MDSWPGLAPSRRRSRDEYRDRLHGVRLDQSWIPRWIGSSNDRHRSASVCVLQGRGLKVRALHCIAVGQERFHSEACCGKPPRPPGFETSVEARPFTKQAASSRPDSLPSAALRPRSHLPLQTIGNTGTSSPESIMLDGHSQAVLGDSLPGVEQSRFVSTLGHRQRQPFCNDPEGWGPVSSSGFHLTPCFLDVLVAVVAVWGTLGGAGALWLLLKKRIPQPVSKNWHFYTKLVRELGEASCSPKPRFTNRWPDHRLCSVL